MIKGFRLGPKRLEEVTLSLSLQLNYECCSWNVVHHNGFPFRPPPTPSTPSSLAAIADAVFALLIVAATAVAADADAAAVCFACACACWWCTLGVGLGAWPCLLELPHLHRICQLLSCLRSVLVLGRGLKGSERTRGRPQKAFRLSLISYPPNLISLTLDHPGVSDKYILNTTGTTPEFEKRYLQRVI